MNHIEVSVNGRHCQKGDAGSSVEEQHEKHSFANCVILTPPFSVGEVVCLYGQTEEQENVGQDQVEEEDIIGVGFPELELEYEEVEDRCIQGQSQDENHNHDSSVEFIQSLVYGLTVFNSLVDGSGCVCHLITNHYANTHNSKKYVCRIVFHFSPLQKLSPHKLQQEFLKAQSKKKIPPNQFFKWLQFLSSSTFKILLSILASVSGVQTVQTLDFFFVLCCSCQGLE